MKLWRLLMVAMATLVCFACSEDTTESEPLQVLELTGEIMPVDEDAESRAQAVDNSNGTVGVYWLPSDHIGVYTSKGTENADFRSTTYSKTNKATFRGSISGTPAYAYFPYSAEAGNDMTAVKATFEPYQYYSTADKELTNDYKIGVYERRLLYINYFSFQHIFSFFRVKVDATGTAMVGEQLEKVILTFPEGVLPSGDFTMNLPAKSYTWSGNNYEKNQLVLEFTDKPTLEEDVVIQGYLTVPPMSNSKGAVVGVSVRSTNKEAVYNGGRVLNVNVAGNITYNYTLTLNDGNYTIADRPAINGLSFTAADNEGKILASKLKYSKSGSTGFAQTLTAKVTADTSVSATTQVMTIDDENNTITGCIPYLFDRNLVPTFSYPSSCKISYSYDGGKNFTAWKSGDPIDFSAGTMIRVDNGSVSRDYKVNITNTGLPVVVINQPGGDTDWSYSESRGSFISGTMKATAETGLKVWSKATDFDNITMGNVAVYNADGTINAEGAGVTRLRGNTTLDMPKKPFAIKLDSKTSVLGMPKHKRWVLLANMKDMSLMRNHIAFGVANTFAEVMPDGIPWHPHGEFVELVYNGVHVGHYYLCEQIKIDKNRVNLKDEYDSEDNPTITEDQVDDFGYLLECDDYFDENTKFLTRHYIPFQFKDDGDEGKVILNYVQTKVQAIEDNLYAGFKNQNLDSYKAAYADMHVPSFVDQLLIYEMTMNSEFGHPRSMYMVMNGKSALACGPVWDFDWLSFPLDNDTQKSLDSGWDRDLSQSLMATPSHINKHYVKRSGLPTSAVTSDVPYHWYPMLITEENFQNLAAERWARVKPYLVAYANEILVQGERLKLSWEYNNAIWPAYDCEAWRKNWCDGGYCGDELFTNYEDVYQAMYEAYMERLNGMNFVTSKSWPTWTITEK